MRLCADFYARPSKSDVPEEVSVTFDPEVDFFDDAFGGSRYEWFYFVCSNYARENISLRSRSREPSRRCI